MVPHDSPGPEAPFISVDHRHAGNGWKVWTPRLWRWPRVDVAWLKEAKPLTSTASHKTSQSPITKGGPQRADVETLPKGL